MGFFAKTKDTDAQKGLEDKNKIQHEIRQEQVKQAQRDKPIGVVMGMGGV